MKKIKSDELFGHLKGFLLAKGVELKEGGVTQAIQKGCTILTDAINFTQNNLRRVRVNVDHKLDAMRQVIHEKTAPGSVPRKPAARPSRKGTAATPNKKARHKKAPGKKTASRLPPTKK